ncbi:hypothetical protein P4U90_11870 [Cytobacillus kochii]|uniref:GNAT family N-acetyltransferase n=1 Tax=Cytobacillus kochii TaxID=859143 RepID=UPI002E1A8D61|nr:GNAT family N-acetyltransferase [Cytobacillus kochii]MED1606025.1 hypothetical protein [Cytobacillus kochii]
MHSLLEALIYYEQLARMKDDGYQLFGLYEENRLVCCYRAFFRVNFCSGGKQVYLSECVTDATVRSKGYGGKLIQLVKHGASYSYF